MNFKVLVLGILLLLIPISATATRQDSFDTFKEKNLSQQYIFLKEQLYTIKNVDRYIDTFLAKATLQKDTSYIASSYYFRYKNYRKSKLYLKAHNAIDTAILFVKNHKKDSLLGTFYHAKGATFYVESKYTDALNYYLHAYDIIRTKSSIDNRLTLEFDIAMIKLKGKKTTEAITDFEHIIASYDSLLQTASNSRFLQIRFIKMLNNTAKSYTDEAMFQKAIELYNKSLLLNETVNHLSSTCIAIGGKGNVFTAEKKYTLALQKLDEALAISRNDSSLKLITPFLLLDKGKCFFGLKKYSEALKNFIETDHIIQAEKLNFVDLDETYQFLAQTYVKLDNHEKANAVYEQYIKRNTISTEKRFELHQTIFEGYDLKNVAYRADEAEKTSNLFKKYFTQTILFTLALAVIAIVFFIFYRNKQKQKLVTFHTLIQELKTTKIEPTGYVLSDEKATKILNDLTALEAKLFFLDKKYNLSTLAKKCNTNSSYLSKVINTHKGKTFSEYMADMRITYVLSALKNDKKLRSYTIQSIAEEIGFKKSESFAKAFKKRTGLNPSFYIKSLDNL